MGLILARGRFNDVKIESLMREHGATVEDYKGVRMIAAPRESRADSPAGSPRAGWHEDFPSHSSNPASSPSVAVRWSATPWICAEAAIT